LGLKWVQVSDEELGSWWGSKLVQASETVLEHRLATPAMELARPQEKESEQKMASKDLLRP
jgi:hypothetical protein